MDGRVVLVPSVSKRRRPNEPGTDAAPPRKPAVRPRLPRPLVECLDVVYRLGLEHLPATAVRVAERLGVGADEGTQRMAALEGLRLARRGPAERFDLTAEGERAALGLVRKHRLLERFLTDLLQLPWERVHEDATLLTPVLSDAVADGLARLLGNPMECPHGNPIPGADGVPPADRAKPLDRLRPGDTATIVRIEKEEGEVLKYLADLGLLPQTRLEVEEVAPLGGPVLVRLGSSRYALGRDVASRIIVRQA